MDFHSLKRRDLQALCKRNNIPANLTNAAMADSLKSLETVQGIDEFLGQLETGGSESPERCVITSSNVHPTSVRQKPSKEGLECSKLATRTRCGTRRVAVEGTDTRKTPATRATRRKETQEASIQQKTQNDLQAKFEESLEHSEASENSGVESIETWEVVSEVSVDQEGRISFDSQLELKHEVAEVNNEGEEIVLVDVDKGHPVNEASEESIETSNGGQKVDFHSLGRKDLQNLCKRNKIPANMTNAAMADALGSLDTVEGLEEFLEGYDPLAMKSPETSRMTSARVRQPRTDRKTTVRKSTQAGSAQCKSLAKKKEGLTTEDEGRPVSVNADEGGQSVDKKLQSCLEACLEMSEFMEYVPENCSTINGESKSVSEEVSTEHDTSVDARVIGTELQDEIVENKSSGSNDQDIGTERSDTVGEFQSNLNFKSNTHDHSAIFGQESSSEIELDVELQDDASQNAGGNQEVKVNNTQENDKKNVDNGLMQEAPEAEIDALAECIEFDNKSGITDILESDINAYEETDAISSDEPDVKGLMQEAPALGTEGFGQVWDFSDAVEVANIEGSEGVLNTDNSKQLGDSVNDVVISEYQFDIAKDISILAKDDMDPESEEDSDVVEGNCTMLKVNIDLKPLTNCAIEDNSKKLGDSVNDVVISNEDEYLKSSSASDKKCSNEEQEVSSAEISMDYEPENGQREFQKVMTSISDATASLPPSEKLEGDETEDQLSKKFVSEPAAQASKSAPKVKGTPLCHKSMRKLKRMLKEKLQEANLLAKKMEKLSLEDDETLVGSNNSDVDLPKQMKEHLTEATEEISDGFNSTTVPVSGTENDCDEESNDGPEMKAKNVIKGGDVLSAADEMDGSGVSILTCNEISGDSVTGHINVEFVDCDNSHLKLDGGATQVDQQVRTERFSIEPTTLKRAGGTEPDTITLPLQFTPTKSSRKTPLFTPIKSSSKTPISAARTTRVVDANKENIDSASKPEAANIKMVVSPAMSIGKLKKEVKVLLLQSERKRPALQSRSDNQCPLASP